MAEDKHSKTEQATPKRLRDSRKKGQVSKSGDLNSALSFLLFALILGALGDYLYKNARTFMQFTLSSTLGQELGPANAGTYLSELLLQVLLIFLPFGLVAVLIGILSNVMQVGFLFTVEPLKPDFKRLNPLQGAKNIFSKKALFTLFKSLMKLFIVVYLTYTGLQEFMKPLLNLGGVGLEKMFSFFIEVTRTLSINIAAFMLVLALIDFVFERKEYKKNLMMTKHEIKEEYKQMEGDPKIKQKRQQIQRQMSMARTMQSVEASTVLITNPTHIAIALRYEQGKDDAPVVMAKGLDYKAMKMKELAKEKKIPIIENKPLARSMYYKVEPGSSVPVEMYQAVAEILALVFTMNRKKKAR
ncbi:flagellar biosynthesis protein FlhB [Proteiniclasticum ruminis]|uniref:flagellar biosynthesis protein FlhB n=1 Tax=Proteiniclasticum ruminis TaxID=398199 RepID=UPI0028AA1F5E|nr:flagellar biosynthesis protein FlhB [Proteiniclasticum ruminis]